MVPFDVFEGLVLKGVTELNRELGKWSLWIVSRSQTAFFFCVGAGKTRPHTKEKTVWLRETSLWTSLYGQIL